ncbi:MAG: hypothetical protein MK030_04275, partial [SAR116 cluster bacterium]|nr:hypothetical protein [SAR116 cluster bacterium]
NLRASVAKTVLADPITLGSPLIETTVFKTSSDGSPLSSDAKNPYMSARNMSSGRMSAEVTDCSIAADFIFPPDVKL